MPSNMLKLTPQKYDCLPLWHTAKAACGAFRPEFKYGDVACYRVSEECRKDSFTQSPGKT